MKVNSAKDGGGNGFKLTPVLQILKNSLMAPQINDILLILAPK